MRYRTTTYSVGAEAIHHHTGLLSTKDTVVRLERIEAIDVHQGPLQRAFGVFAVDVQTGAAGKGGEISLPALTPEAVAELRAARPQAVSSLVERGRARGPEPDARGRDLAIAALTAGQLGIVLPVLAGAGQILQQLFSEERGEEAIRWLPHTVTAIVLGARRAARARVGAVRARRGRRLRRLHRHPRRRPAADPPRRRSAQRGDRARRAGAGGARRRGHLPAPVRARRADRRGHRLRRGGLRRAHALPARARPRRRGVPGASSCPSWPTTRAVCRARPPAPPAATSCSRCSRAPR